MILRPKFLKNQQQSSAPPTQPREKVRLSTNTTQSKSPISRAVLSTYGNWVERLRLLQAHLAEQMAGDTALTIAQQYHAVTDELQRAINSPPQNSDELATQIAGGAKRLQALRLDLSLSWDQKANLSARMRRVQAHAS